MFDIPYEYRPPTVMNKILMPKEAGEFQGLPDTILDALSLSQKFSFVGSIKIALLAKFGEGGLNTDTPIDETSAPNEIKTMHQLQNRLTLSDDYQNLIINITQAAVDDLTQQTQFVNSLVNWHHLTEYQRVTACQHFNDTMMQHAKSAFEQIQGANQLAETADAVWIKTTYKEPVQRPSGEEQITKASAQANLETAPGCKGIKVNTHPKAFLNRDAVETMGMMAHETAHVIENLFAYLYDKNPQNIPPQFQKDAELFQTMHKYRGYVGSSIRSVYEAQANERLAQKAGALAKNAFIPAMANAIKNSFLNRVSATP